MVELYLLRHTETVGNEQRLFQGRIDLEISHKGTEQLQLIGQRFENIHIDKVYSSPLPRAVKTARAALGGRTLKITEEPLLIEIDGGELEGHHFTEIFAEGSELGDAWYNHIESFKAPGGESMKDVYDRAWEGLRKLLSDPDNDGKTILAVSHGAAVRCIICRLLYGDISRLMDTGWSDNTAVSHIFYEDGKITLDYANDISHLPEEMRRQGKSFFNFGRKE